METAKRVASLISVRRDQQAPKYILMLGAGASISSGVPAGATLVQELVRNHGDGIEGNVDQRFDELWRRATPDDRKAFLRPYLTKAPSSGYTHLAKLLKDGFFDVVVTFNFDTLLEDALSRAGVGANEFRVIIRGEVDPNQLQRLLDSDEPRIKIIKLHGSLRSSDYFLFDSAEMYRYPEPVEGFVNKLTARDTIVCGYRFDDACVIRAFSDRGGSVVCVDPGGPSTHLRGLMRLRNSDGSEIRSTFDEFFAELRQHLTADRNPGPAPSTNPFKFLESHDVSDRPALRMRDLEIAEFFDIFARDPIPRVIVLSGPGRAGKTSLVRAGLLSRLRPHGESDVLGLYVRCHSTDPSGPPTPGGEKRLPSALLGEFLPGAVASCLAACGETPPSGLDLAGTLQHLANRTDGKRVVLFLDQFERLTAHVETTRAAEAELVQDLRRSLPPTGTGSLTVVFVTTDDGRPAAIRRAAEITNIPAATLQCASFSRDEVASIIGDTAREAGFDFDPRIIDGLADGYERTRGADVHSRFTLAHVHAVCHLLARTRVVSFQSYRDLFDSPSLAELHEAINVAEYASFTEDHSWPSSAWLRSMLKVPLRTRERMARYIIDNLHEIIPPEARPRLPRTDQ